MQELKGSTQYTFAHVIESVLTRKKKLRRKGLTLVMSSPFPQLVIKMVSILRNLLVWNAPDW